MGLPTGAAFRSAMGRLRSPHAREQRPWALIAASLLLAMLAMVLWLTWAESRNRAARLESEIQQVRAEAEAARTLARREGGRLAGLEREVQALRVERDRLLRRLEDVEAQLAKGTARSGRGGPSR